MSALLVTGCSDDATTTTEHDAAMESDVSERTDAAAEDTLACEHPCLDEFGKNAKKLCPVPQAEWKCIDGCCVPIFKCETDDDCLVQGFEEGQCTDSRFDCRCDGETGVCHPWLCGSDDDCEEGDRCFAGACVATPDAGDFTLRILNRGPVVQPGASSPLFAEAVDPEQDDVVVQAPFAWTSSDPNVAAVDTNGLVTGGDVGGVVTISAQLPGGAADSVQVTNLVASSDATLTALLHAEQDRSPLTGQYLIVDGGGDTLAKGEIPSDGIIRVNATFTSADLHVFGADADWNSWTDLSPGVVLYAPVHHTVWAALDLNTEVEIVPDSSELVGADVITGTPDFSLYPSIGSVELTLTGFDFDGSLLEFNLPQIIGANVQRYFHPDNVLPGLNDTEIAELPGGLTFALEGPAIPEYFLAAPGGTHRIWTLGGRLDINQLAEYADDILDAVTGGSVEFTSLLGALFPLFDAFWSAVHPPLAVAGDGSLTPTQYNPKLEMPLTLKTLLDVPDLPPLPGGGWPELAFLVVGAETPDGRLTPLGLSTGADSLDEELQAPDGVIDADPDTPERDGFLLHGATRHSGVAGPHTAYTSAILAVNVGLSDNNDRPEAGSAIFVHGEPGGGLPSAPALKPFLDFPTDVVWEAATRTITMDTVDGADLQRVLFRGDRGSRWIVWLGDTPSATLPVPAEHLDSLDEDRAETSELILVSNIALVEDCSPATLMAPGHPTLDLLLNVTERTVFIEVP